MGYEAQNRATVYADSGERKTAAPAREAAKKSKKDHHTKRIAPDTAAVIFTLTNRDPKLMEEPTVSGDHRKNGKDLLAGAKLITGMSKDDIAKFLSDD
ncbi:MAG: hypothetical protein ACLR8Y_15400 [Alistipes indistinctus]